jgi:hypothetical protein
LTYGWSQTEGAQVTLNGADSATATFTAPGVNANGDMLTFQLTVKDENGNNATDTVNVKVSDNPASVNNDALINKIFDSNLPQLFLFLVFLIIIIPLVMDIFLAYRRKKIEGSNNKQSPRVFGLPGLNRPLMAFGIIVLLGTVVFSTRR